MFNISNYIEKTYLDSPQAWTWGFQDPATPIMEGIIDFHHDIMVFLVFIFVFVTWVLLRTIYHFHYTKNSTPYEFSHGTTIEILWTLFPSIILMTIAFPSFALLYSMDEIVEPSLTLKVAGHQWYWSYEYSDYTPYSVNFESYMLSEDSLSVGQPRLLEVDNRVVLPSNTNIRVLITSSDVIHSWAIPSLGVKCDAIPGRLNQVSLHILREGVFYGQCSEICGYGHGFMPIVIESVAASNYIDWIAEKSEEI